jgi:hypothetical protein
MIAVLELKNFAAMSLSEHCQSAQQLLEAHCQVSNCWKLIASLGIVGSSLRIWEAFTRPVFRHASAFSYHDISFQKGRGRAFRERRPQSRNLTMRRC